MTVREPRGRPPAHIVLLERDEAVRATLRALLGESGFEVEVVSDWAQARESLWRPCAMLVLDIDDAQLGEMYLLLRELGARDALPPVVVVSDQNDGEDVLAGVRLGVRDWLLRPLRAGEVVHLVRRHLRRGGTRPKGPAHLPGSKVTNGADHGPTPVEVGAEEGAVRIPAAAAPSSGGAAEP